MGCCDRVKNVLCGALFEGELKMYWPNGHYGMESLVIVIELLQDV
jgi:hypothetical protein